MRRLGVIKPKNAYLQEQRDFEYIDWKFALSSVIPAQAESSLRTHPLTTIWMPVFTGMTDLRLDTK